MISWRRGTVISVGRSWPGAIEVVADVDGSALQALAYPLMVGTPQVGDVVLLNTTALDLGLGTGGYAMVIALPDRLPADTVDPGLLMKARYTPQQVSVSGIDAQESTHHELLADADSLDGMPVVIADLHSALPAVLAGLLLDRPATRAVYLMSDGGALPLWFSRTVAGLREAGWLAATVTVGQAFGGDVEAVTLHTGLLAAHRVFDAEVVVIAQGPGNLGTGTRWGFSGVAAGEAVNAVAVLGGRPIASLRMSDADPRTRHQGISHHSRTAYGRVALTAADVVVPALAGPLAAAVEADLQTILAAPAGHRAVQVSAEGLLEALTACPVELATMGRSLADDPAYFVAAAAAGRHAASLLPVEPVRPAAG
ncbi:MAG: hypothetical protein QOJ62_220 [Actinomycetota bacterium]|nr:hypothetical protein [Actinomycetota bacterium]